MSPSGPVEVDVNFWRLLVVEVMGLAFGDLSLCLVFVLMTNDATGFLNVR